MTPARRTLAEVESDLATLDALLLPLRDFDRAEAEAPGLLDQLSALHRARDFALNAQGTTYEPVTVAPRGAA